MELYLVTIDTTFSQKLGKSLQNYGICLASDPNNARERFIQPLRTRVPPNVLADIYPYVYAYKLSDITETINDQHPMWAYVSNSQNRSVGQQTKYPFFVPVPNTIESPPPIQEVQPTAPPIPIVEEFKAPDGVTDPVQLAMLKTMYDMAKEIKSLKSAPSNPQTGSKVSILDLESQFRAPPPASIMPGSSPLNVNSIPVPQVPHVTSFPKGKIDRETKARLEQNMRPSNFEVID